MEGGGPKGRLELEKNPAQYSALSANRLHSVSGKITSSLFQSSAVALSGGFLVARSLLFDSRDEGGREGNLVVVVVVRAATESCPTATAE